MALLTADGGSGKPVVFLLLRVTASAELHLDLVKRRRVLLSGFGFLFVARTAGPAPGLVRPVMAFEAIDPQRTRVEAVGERNRSQRGLEHNCLRTGFPDRLGPQARTQKGYGERNR
ncbi:MAG: hypothetical protein ABIN58_11625 [candidate division WOR-3 bacterium]